MPEEIIWRGGDCITQFGNLVAESNYPDNIRMLAILFV